MIARAPVYDSLGRTLLAWAILIAVGIVGLLLLARLDKKGDGR